MTSQEKKSFRKNEITNFHFISTEIPQQKIQPPFSLSLTMKLITDYLSPVFFSLPIEILEHKNSWLPLFFLARSRNEQQADVIIIKYGRVDSLWSLLTREHRYAVCIHITTIHTSIYFTSGKYYYHINYYYYNYYNIIITTV